MINERKAFGSRLGVMRSIMGEDERNMIYGVSC